MTEVTRLRNSTQILLPSNALDGLRGEPEDRFVVTVRQEGNGTRIIGSPAVIKDVSRFLTRNGVAID